MESFWLNDYHHEYTRPSQSTALTFYEAFARLVAAKSVATSSTSAVTVTCRQLHSVRLLEATVFMNNDTFECVVVTVQLAFDHEHARHHNKIVVQAIFRPLAGFHSIRFSRQQFEEISAIEVSAIY
jgi:Xylosyltransferase C terminal